jgi:hypothetical protein
MWPSLPVANHIADIANWFFVGSLVVGVVSTILIVWMAGVKETHWELDRRESGERIAQLNNDTERLKSDNLRLQTQLAPRSLSKEQFDEIQTLKGHLTAVNIAVEDDVECNMFAALLGTAIQKAGVIVRQYNLPAGFRGNSGLMLYDQHAFENPGGEPTNGEPLSGVLKRANLFVGAMLARLPDGFPMPVDTPAIFVVERPSLPYVTAPYFGPPAATTDDATPQK